MQRWADQPTGQNLLTCHRRPVHRVGVLALRGGGSSHSRRRDRRWCVGLVRSALRLEREVHRVHAEARLDLPLLESCAGDEPSRRFLDTEAQNDHVGAPEPTSWAPRNRVDALDAHAASTLMIGTPGRPTRSITFWPLAISAPTLPTRTRSTSAAFTPASASAVRAGVGAQRAIAGGESTERVDPDPGDLNVTHGDPFCYNSTHNPSAGGVTR